MRRMSYVRHAVVCDVKIIKKIIKSAGFGSNFIKFYQKYYS